MVYLPTTVVMAHSLAIIVTLDRKDEGLAGDCSVLMILSFSMATVKTGLRRHVIPGTSSIDVQEFMIEPLLISTPQIA